MPTGTDCTGSPALQLNASNSVVILVVQGRGLQDLDMLEA